MPIKHENRRLYPRNWKEIRAEVLERADNRCEFCEAHNHGMIQSYSHRGWSSVKVVLTISHLDHDPTNNGEPGNRPNLRALCQRCHNRHDAKIRSIHARENRRAKRAVRELF